MEATVRIRAAFLEFLYSNAPARVRVVLFSLRGTITAVVLLARVPTIATRAAIRSGQFKTAHRRATARKAISRDIQRGREGQPERADLKPLTSLRFAAALLVFVTHAPVTRPFAVHHELGNAGVGFFFVLSGFILTWTYFRSFAKRLTWIAVWNFYVARLARIYPMLVTTTAIAAMVLLLGHGRHGRLWYNGELWLTADLGGRLRVLLAALTMTQSWTPNLALINGVNPPSWSIATEAFFYVLFPLLTSYLIRSLRDASPLAVFIGAAALWASVTVAVAPLPSNPWPIIEFPPVRMIDFMIGILVAIGVRKGARFPLPTTSECLVILATIAMIANLPLVPASLRVGLALIPFWALVVIVFAPQGGAISRALSTPSLVRLGEISFAFYLIHYPVLYAVTAVCGGWLADIVALCIALGISYALFVYVETPCRKAIRQALTDLQRTGEGSADHVESGSAHSI